MKLHQLEFLCEVVDHGFNISSAANTLFTSQPSVSRQLQELEEEIGVRIFLRSKRRILGLTEPGSQILNIARRILAESNNIVSIGRDYSDSDTGRLTVSTSHTHARYVLPSVIRTFSEKYPKVQVTLRQANPSLATTWVATGEADVSISSDPVSANPHVVLLRCYEQHKIVLAPSAHPLHGTKHVTLAHLAAYPIITYDSQYSTYWHVISAFEKEGLQPRIVLSATDVDVMKTYVKQGMGIAILAALGYNKAEDTELRAIDVRHLFEPNHISIGIRKNAYLRRYVVDFINMFSPDLHFENAPSD